MGILGVGILVILWAMLIAWIARAAGDRGRSVFAWALIGAAAGIGGLVASSELIAHVIEPFGGNTMLLLTLLTPLTFLIVPMAAIAVGLGKFAAHAAHRRTWRVHSAKRGSGRLLIGRDRLKIVWTDGDDDIPFTLLRRVDPDGECLRLAWADSEHVLMPLEKPDTRAGRQAQSRALASQIDAGRTTAHPPRS
jgi:hypothetical protein